MKCLSCSIASRLLLLFFVLNVPAMAADYPSLSDSVDGVTITVSPATISAASTSWEFHVSLDTHSGALDDDLLQNSRLLDDQGGEHAPVTWDGDPAGGHHRKGALQFAPLKPMPIELRLRLQRAGESKSRLFVWQVK